MPALSAKSRFKRTTSITPKLLSEIITSSRKETLARLHPTLKLSKCFLTSIISTMDGRFMTMDIINLYLNNPHEHQRYLRIRIDDVPQYLINEYNLISKIKTDGYTSKFKKGVYGLPQAGKLTNCLLALILNKACYYRAITTPGLLRYKWRPIMFCLIVDGFGVQIWRQRTCIASQEQFDKAL